MSKQLNIACEDYTVYMFVAPTNAGKSTLANQLHYQLLKSNTDCRILSSDDIRRDLISDKDANKYDPRMLEVSQQAFSILYAKLRNYISYPVNMPHVIIDSTGLNEKFRNDIINICRDHNYKLVCILFDYKDAKDWFANKGGDKYIIQKHLNKLQKHVFKDIKIKDYHKIIRIKERVESVDVTYTKDTNNLVVKGNNYTIIGDVHGCVNELKELISNIDNTPILVGDWIDSKANTDDVFLSPNALIIDYLIANPQILLVKGNHEENLYKHIKVEDYTESPFFNSRKLIAVSPEYKTKFIELYNRSYSSIRGKGFIVTHAPCKNKYLLTSVNKMTNLYYTEENKSNLINDLYDDKYNNNCWPLHLYGHLTFDKPIKTKYSIGLDTGVSYGGMLTGYNLITRKFISIKSLVDDNVKQLNSISKFTSKVEESNIKLKDDEDIKKLNLFINNSTPYISGTMAPAMSTEFTLEDITSALAYYKNKGQTKVLIQPKYMGSRAQVLLTKDINNYEVFTRNGFKLKHTEELDEAISKLQDSLSEDLIDFIKWNNEGNSVLFDCELMPWSYMSKGLIKEIFELYYHSHKSYNANMHKYGFYEDIIKYKNSEEFKNNKSLNKDNSNLIHWKYIDTSNELELFIDELDKYKQDIQPYFLPFNILKVESETEILYSNADFNKFNNKDLFSLLNTPVYEVAVDDLEEAKRIQSLYETEEGIVIKPYYNELEQAPYIKVRSKNYLRLVYGHNYTNNLDRLISKKNVSSKLRLSINEWMLGNDLLNIPFCKFTKDNKDYVQTLIKLMFEFKKELELDPRL